MTLKTCDFRSVAAALPSLSSYPSFPPKLALAWGREGHRINNRLAVVTLPEDVPAFHRTEAAKNEIEYLGPEPDRWRSRGEPELSDSQAPAHVIDFELSDALGPLPPPESRAFAVERIAAGALELRDLIYTAWVESANPVPDGY